MRGTSIVDTIHSRDNVNINEIKKSLESYKDDMGENPDHILFYLDGSGQVRSYDGNCLISFDSVKDLKQKLSEL